MRVVRTPLVAVEQLGVVGEAQREREDVKQWLEVVSGRDARQEPHLKRHFAGKRISFHLETTNGSPRGGNDKGENDESGKTARTEVA